MVSFYSNHSTHFPFQNVQRKDIGTIQKECYFDMLSAFLWGAILQIFSDNQCIGSVAFYENDGWSSLKVSVSPFYSGFYMTH